VLRKIFGPKRDELTGGRIKLRKEDLHNLYSSQNVIMVIKSRRIRYAGHVARMGLWEMGTKFSLGSLTERVHWEDPS
jgi:hypothetical protein